MVDVIMKFEVKTFDIFKRGDNLLEQRMSIAKFPTRGMTACLLKIVVLLLS
jgi:hypothetical protein